MLFLSQPYEDLRPHKLEVELLCESNPIKLPSTSIANLASSSYMSAGQPLSISLPKSLGHSTTTTTNTRSPKPELARAYTITSANYSFLDRTVIATGPEHDQFNSSSHPTFSICQRRPVSRSAVPQLIEKISNNNNTYTAKDVAELAGLLPTTAPIDTSYLIRAIVQACSAGNSRIRSSGYLLIQAVVSHQESISINDRITLWKALTSAGMEKNRIARRRQLEAVKLILNDDHEYNIVLLPGLFEQLLDWLSNTTLPDAIAVKFMDEILCKTVTTCAEYLEEGQLDSLLGLCCSLVRSAIDAQMQFLGTTSSYGPPVFFPFMAYPDSTEPNAQSQIAPVLESAVLFSNVVHSINEVNIIPDRCIPTLARTLCLLHEFIETMQSLEISKVGPRAPLVGRLHVAVERTTNELLNDKCQGGKFLTAIEDLLLRSSTYQSAIIALGAICMLSGIFWDLMSDLTQQAPVAPVISEHGLPKIVTTTKLDRIMQAMQRITKTWISTSEEDNFVVSDGERILLELVSLVERLVGYCEYDESSQISIFVGSVISDLATIIKRQRNFDGSLYQMSLCNPDAVSSTLVARIEHVLDLPMESTIMQPPLDLILLTLPDHLCDPNLFRVVDHLQSSGKLDPRSPDWAVRMRTLLDVFAKTRSSEYLLSRRAIASVLSKAYDDVVDLGHFHNEVVENVIDMWEKTLPDETDPIILQIAFEVLSKEIVLSATADDTATNPNARRIHYIWAELARQKHENCDEHLSNSHATEDATSSDGHACERSRVFLAVKFLIVAFNVFAFKSPQALEVLLTDADRCQSESAASMAVDLFRNLARLCGVNKEGKRQGKPNIHCRKARLLLVQWMMRLRASGDHRIFLNRGFLPEVLPLAQLIFRSGPDENQYEQKERLTDQERRRNRTRAGTRLSRKDSLRKEDDFIECDMNMISIGLQQYTLWKGPDSLLEELYTGTAHPSPAMTTFAKNEGASSPYWLPVSAYVDSLCETLTYGRDWEITSYILCHLPLQLANKHFFCGNRVVPEMQRLVKTIYESIHEDRLFHRLEGIQPQQLEAKHVRALLYHNLTVLISYRRAFTASEGQIVATVKEIKPKIIESLVAGLGNGLTTSRPCIEGLAHVVYALPDLLSSFLPSIVEKLSRLITSSEMVVHILEFLFIVGYTPQTWIRSFRERDYRLVFGIALNYIEHHYRPDKATLMTGDGKHSYALAQHVLNKAFFVIHLWFLAIRVDERAKFVPFIIEHLLAANQGKQKLEPTTEVCLDWLSRYAYGSADPKVSPSFLYNSIVSPYGGSRFSVKRSWDEKQMNENKNIVAVKAWKLGNSIITVATMKRPPGWIRVLVRRPSCIAELICRPEGQRNWIPVEIPPEFTDTVEDTNPAINEGLTEESLEISEVVVESLVKKLFNDRDITVPDPVSGVAWNQAGHIPNPKIHYQEPGQFAFLLDQYNSRPDDQPYPFPDYEKLKSTLRLIDGSPVIDTHKVAVVYVAPGQSNEMEILGNQHGSPAYTLFIRNLGRLVKPGDSLEVYTGGLQAELHGEYALAWWDDMAQIIYHVATMMPNIRQDHMNKKQEIGNDAVKIVWNDSGRPYVFNTICSEFSLFDIIVEPHTLMPRSAFEVDSHANGYFKVLMQIDPRLPRITPIGEFKIVLESQLPNMIRHFTLLASLFCNAWLNTGEDGEFTYPLNTNWQQRLQYISKSEKLLEQPTETS